MLHRFDYFAPGTKEELHSILADRAPEAALLGGGTALLVNMRDGLARPRCVINVKKVAGATELAWSDQDGLVIPAGVTINDLLRSPKVREAYPLLASCGRELASYQIRNRATVVGNVVTASPCSDMAPALLCLKASVVLASRRGERQMPFQAFYKGFKQTELRADEVLERILVPAASAGARGQYRKFRRTQGHDVAIVGVALLKHQGTLRIALSSAGPAPVYVGDLDLTRDADPVVAAVLAAVNPSTDLRCTREYRLHLVETFVRRLLEEVKG